MKAFVTVLCLCAASLGSASWAQEEVSRGAGATLRVLDKITGKSEDLALLSGQDAVVGSMLVGLTDCRYPAGNPAGDAYAYITIDDGNEDRRVFSGWMLASSPALNALDHDRYDVWVLRCTTS